jgi:beta-mannosidase
MDAEHPSAGGSDYSKSSVKTDGWLVTDVPGDIHPTLQKAGILPDPFIELNAEKCLWTGERDWWYRRDITIPKSFDGEKIELVFDGIDTYAGVYVNGVNVGETANSFRQYRFDITDKINLGQKNCIAVCVLATKKILESRDTSKYAACFYTPRVFARKAQCQFSWDWAPHLPAMGIWRDVRIETKKAGVIEDVHVRTKITGEVHFSIEIDDAGKKLVKSGQKLEIEIEISDGKKRFKKHIFAVGRKNFTTLSIPNPKLWWPNGYGKPELYSYKITLRKGSKTLDEKIGKFGVRKVELLEEPIGEGMQGFRFRVNGVDIFCMGANWVPADCFPGTLKKERYEHLIRLTREANFNMLRIWGGGIYESDSFYDMCDENGIMVWQDMMFACSDIPDDDSAFTRGLIPEFEYQVKRLRNHPCIVHWCGGNEKTGTFAEMVHFGEIVTHYLARGVIEHFAPDATYTPSSPYSLTDVGNEPASGDTHGGTYEEAFVHDITKFREHIDRKRAAFMSEFGLHGPPQMRSLRKFMPADKLWPLNEVWEYHVQDNPYNSLAETFVEVQHKSASTLFHSPDSASEFIKVAGTFHAEYLYDEFLHHRRRLPENTGALIWMLNDCWPCASWSIIDYYGLPKQVYYALKRACSPVVVSFRQIDKGWEVYITHNLPNSIKGKLTVQLQTVDGTVVKKFACKNINLSPRASAAVMQISAKDVPHQKNSYFFAELDYNGKKTATTYFHNLWKDIAWPEPELKMTVGKLTAKDGENVAVVTLKTKRYARCVNISTAEDIHAYFSDNFFDMTPGQTRQITIRSPRCFNPAALRLNHWLTKWD